MDQEGNNSIRVSSTFNTEHWIQWWSRVALIRKKKKKKSATAARLPNLLISREDLPTLPCSGCKTPHLADSPSLCPVAELPFPLHFTANALETSVSLEPFHISHSSIIISDVCLSNFLLGQPSTELLATKSQVLLPFLSFLIYQLWLTACTSSLVLANTTCFPSDYFLLGCIGHWNANIPFLLCSVPGCLSSPVFIGSPQALYHLTEKDIFNCNSFPPLCL